MATPMLLMGADKGKTATEEQTKKAEATKSSRAKKSGAKNPNQKKQPQRGLGVAQLERLRLQERWKKMTEMPSPLHFHCQSPFLLDPTLAVQFPAPPAYGGAPALVGNNDSGGNGGVLGFDHQGLVVPRIGNNGGFIGGGGLMVVEPYPHGGGAAVDPRLLIGNTVEASRELSSIPKLPPPPCVSDHRCDICFKKKRVNFTNGVKEKNIAAAETPPPPTININNSFDIDFLGLSTNSAGELSSSAVRGGAIPSSVDHYTGFSFNFNQGGAEIKQIHRKVVGKNGGGSEGSGGSLLMEYEFFPGKNGRNGTEFEELEMPKAEELGFCSYAEEVVLVDHGEASCITTSYCTDMINNGGTSSSSAVDLSLKLSF